MSNSDGKTLIYRMTHHHDPCPKCGIWGSTNCMGSIRKKWNYDAVVGIAGKGYKDKDKEHKEGDIVWVGREPHKETKKWPRVNFRYFKVFKVGEKNLKKEYRNLYKKIPRSGYLKNITSKKFVEYIDKFIEKIKKRSPRKDKEDFNCSCNPRRCVGKKKDRC